MKHEGNRAPLRRDQALAFIIESIVSSGFSPSYDELARALAVSKTRAKHLIVQLIECGSIERTPGAQRSLRVLDVKASRAMLVEALKRLGWSASERQDGSIISAAAAGLPTLPPFECVRDG